jgi:hypothetical protein
MRTTGWRRGFVAALAALVCLAVVPATAYAAILARVSASQKITVLTWQAVAVSTGGSPGQGSLSASFTVADKKNRAATFDIVNTGTATLSGVTLSASTSGVASGATVAYTACSRAWALAPNSKAFTCTGAGASTNNLGSVTGSGSTTISVSLAPGARLSVRATTTAPDETTATSQTISIKVSRSQAPAKRNR